MRNFKLVVLTLIIVVFAIFVFQNLETVNLKLFNWGIKFPLAFIIAAFYILGTFTGGILASNLKKLVKDKSKEENSSTG